MKLYLHKVWFDVEHLCNDDVKYHDTKKLLVDYESYDELKKAFHDLMEIAYCVDSFSQREADPNWDRIQKIADKNP